MRKDAKKVKNVCQVPLRGPGQFTKTKEQECIMGETRTETYAPLRKTTPFTQLRRVVRYVPMICSVVPHVLTAVISRIMHPLHSSSHLTMTDGLWPSVGPADRTVDCPYVLGIYSRSRRCPFLRHKQTQKQVSLRRLHLQYKRVFNQFSHPYAECSKLS